MAFTEHRYKRKEIEAIAADIAANAGVPDLLPVAVKAIATRISRDKSSYRWYGPWWWSLKKVMLKHGHDYGSDADPLTERAYGFDDDLLTIIAADQFRNWYMDTQFIGTSEFVLDADAPDFYTLWDDGMESTI